MFALQGPLQRLSDKHHWTTDFGPGTRRCTHRRWQQASVFCRETKVTTNEVHMSGSSILCVLHQQLLLWLLQADLAYTATSQGNGSDAGVKRSHQHQQQA